MVFNIDGDEEMDWEQEEENRTLKEGHTVDGDEDDHHMRETGL